jgi:predicted TIM-barrel fold metal-dependent hydrolase
MRIIDCHAHFGYFSQTRIAFPDAGSMLREMDRAGVERLCISSFLGIGPDARAGNDLVAQAVRSHPDRLLGYATVNPNRPGEVPGELDRCFSRLGMKAIKLHPAFHDYGIEGSAYRSVFEFANEHRLLILSHEWGRPEFLERISEVYPQVNFLIAHTGFWNGRSDFAWAGVLQRRANVFVDLVYSNIFYEVLERMVAEFGAAKILWGSDFPLHDLGYQLGRMLFSKLNPEDRSQILGGNMLRILGE